MKWSEPISLSSCKSGATLIYDLDRFYYGFWESGNEESENP